jgi:hypothetical protein
MADTMVSSGIMIFLAWVLGSVLPAFAGDPPAPVVAALSTLGLAGGQPQALALPADVGDGLLVEISLDGSLPIRVPAVQLKLSRTQIQS